MADGRSGIHRLAPRINIAVADRHDRTADDIAYGCGREIADDAGERDRDWVPVTSPCMRNA